MLLGQSQGPVSQLLAVSQNKIASSVFVIGQLNFVTCIDGNLSVAAIIYYGVHGNLWMGPDAVTCTITVDFPCV